MRSDRLALGQLAIALILVSAGAPAKASNPCLEGPTAQFGRYVGDWKITDQRLSQDGTTWQAGAGARWTFECIGNGIAIQDYWQPHNSPGWGTNLRTYNPKTARWEIVWAATGVDGLQRIGASQLEDGSILMEIEHPIPAQPRRIIFYPPTEQGWHWTMQWSMDEGKTWFDVYRMDASPWAND